MDWKQLAHLLTEFDEATRDALLAHFTEEERQKIQSYSTALGGRSSPDAAHHLNSMIDRLVETLSARPAWDGTTYRLVSNSEWPDPHRPENLSGSVEAEGDRIEAHLTPNGPWEQRECGPEPTPETWAQLLRDEHPRVAAALIGHWASGDRLVVLARLPRNVQEAISRVTFEGRPHPGLLKALESEVQEMATESHPNAPPLPRFVRGVGLALAAVCLWILPWGSIQGTEPALAARLQSAMEHQAHDSVTSPVPSGVPTLGNHGTDPFDVVSVDGTFPEALVNQFLRILGTVFLWGLVPALALATTSFVRISIVLSLLRHAFGPSQFLSPTVITSLSFVLTLTVMAPIWQQAYEQGLRPYQEGQPGITPQIAWERGIQPIRNFMNRQIESANYYQDVALFMEYTEPQGTLPEQLQQVPLAALLPAFFLGELRTAFYIGFRVFIPFLVIDLVVAVLTASLGLMNLSPATLALPAKLIVFVLADGWNLVVQSLLSSFGT